MIVDDMTAVRRPSSSWPRSLCCAVCAGAPTCPMLRDDVWGAAWGRTRLADPRARECSCPPDALVHARPHDWSHGETCELRLGARALLCFECTEMLLERELGVDDLAPCVGNYALVVMMTRPR